MNATKSTKYQNHTAAQLFKFMDDEFVKSMLAKGCPAKYAMADNLAKGCPGGGCIDNIEWASKNCTRFENCMSGFKKTFRISHL